MRSMVRAGYLQDGEVRSSGQDHCLDFGIGLQLDRLCDLLFLCSRQDLIRVNPTKKGRPRGRPFSLIILVSSLFKAGFVLIICRFYAVHFYFSIILSIRQLARNFIPHRYVPLCRRNIEST